MEAILETFRPVRGYEGLYEASDYGCVRSLQFKCKKRIKYLKNAKHPTGYERIDLYRDGKYKKLFVHRLVYEAFVGEIPEGYEIDHINTIRDDNRLSNLRCVTRKENHANPITAARNREANRRNAKDPQWREATREANKRRSQDPKWLEANREAGKHRSENPKWREAVREANRRNAKDPQWREAHREGTRKARNKHVFQIDKQTGEVIRKWECAADVERELGFNHGSISACCHGKLKSAGGFKWQFAS